MLLRGARRHESQALLEALNRVYEDYLPTPEETEARCLMKRKQQEMSVSVYRP